MKRFIPLLPGALLALLTMIALTPQAHAQAEHHQHETHQHEAVTIADPDVVVHVKGLACGMCARSVTNSLKKLDAVKDIQVLLEDDQRVLLTLKDGTTVSEEALREAVTDAGFTTREVVYARHDDAGEKTSDHSRE